MDRIVEAVVQAGCFETSYLRSGQGAPVLLIADGIPAGLHQMVFRRLVERFRVIAPALPHEILGDASNVASTAAAGRWLEGVIEGLGIERAALVVAEPVDRLLAGGWRRGDGGIERVAILRSTSRDAEPFPEDPLAVLPQAVCRLDGNQATVRRALDDLVHFLDQREH